MGVQGLLNFIRTRYPTAFKDIHLRDLYCKKIAVDTNLYLYKYKIISPNWKDCFIRLVCCCRRYNVHPIFIFDTSAPLEKRNEQLKRRENVQKTREQVDSIENLLKTYYTDKIISPELQKFYDECLTIRNNKQNNQRNQSLLRRFLHTTNLPPPSIQPSFNPQLIEERLRKLKSRIVGICDQDKEDLKLLFENMGVGYFQAIEEAEQTCSYLCKWGLVDGVLTEDSDVIAYGAPLFISKIEVFNGNCTLLETPVLLEKLQMTQEQLLDFCIMLQCDYNSRIPSVGPASAYKLLKEHGSLEQIEANTKYDLSCLNYKRCRELFACAENTNQYTIVYSKPPNYQKLGKYLYEHDCLVTLKYIKESCNYDCIE